MYVAPIFRRETYRLRIQNTTWKKMQTKPNAFLIPLAMPLRPPKVMSLIKHVKPLHLLPMHRNVSGKHLLLREAISPLIDVEKAVTLCANINKYTSASNSKIEDPKRKGEHSKGLQHEALGQKKLPAYTEYMYCIIMCSVNMYISVYTRARGQILAPPKANATRS